LIGSKLAPVRLANQIGQPKSLSADRNGRARIDVDPGRSDIARVDPTHGFRLMRSIAGIAAALRNTG
jgi:hypothetical protein